MYCLLDHIFHKKKESFNEPTMGADEPLSQTLSDPPPFVSMAVKQLLNQYAYTVAMSNVPY